MDLSGTSHDTGEDGTLEAAAEAIARRLPGDGDHGFGEAWDLEEAYVSDGDQDLLEEEQNGAEGEGEPEELVVTVTVDGEEVPVTLHELKRGFLREQDYTRKTMALAEARRALEEEHGSFALQRDAYAAALSQLEDFLQLQGEDGEQLDAVAFERQRIAQEQALEEAQGLAVFVEDERERLSQAIPDWSDSDRAREERVRIKGYALSLGFAPEELDQVYDHRVVLALRDAMRWRALEERRPQVQSRLAGAPRAVRPGAAQPPPGRGLGLSRSKERLARSGRVEDAARAIEQLLGD